MLYSLMAIFGIVGLAYGLYQFLISFVGTVRRRPPFPPSDTFHRFAALIPARNEEAVISQLIKDLARQDYPRERFDIYAIPNNCSDNTAEAALLAGAKIIHVGQDVHTKGDVLDRAFHALTEEDIYDAYLIFDADNRVDPGFVNASNDALSAGYQVGQGYRDSLNADSHWIAGNSSEFFWFMNRLYNQARFGIKMSAALNGTGIMIGREAIKKIGWKVSSLTEDLEFTALCALHRVKICFMRAAVLYDEQPSTARDSVIQRRRWTAGTLQCFRKYFLRLVLCAVRYGSASALDIALVFAGPIIQLISIVPFVATMVLAVQDAIYHPNVTALMAAYTIVGSALGFWVACAAFVLLVCGLEKKLSLNRVRDMLTMPLFLASWSLINFYCLFSKPPEWVQIRHGDHSPIKKPRDRDIPVTR